MASFYLQIDFKKFMFCFGNINFEKVFPSKWNVISEGNRKKSELIELGFFMYGGNQTTGLEPISMQLSGGQLLPPVQTLVASVILCPVGQRMQIESCGSTAKTPPKWTGFLFGGNQARVFVKKFVTESFQFV